jgi:hypothetical protein
MAIDRTVFNASVDDSGTGTDGTIEDKAWFDAAILDPIDAAIAAAGVSTGTFSPILLGTGGQSGQTYEINTATYTKIGPHVLFNGRLTLSTLGTISGNVAIGGFPHTTPALWNPGILVVNKFFHCASGVIGLSGYMNPSTAYFFLQKLFSPGGGTNDVTSADLTNTSDIFFGGFYIV